MLYMRYYSLECHPFCPDSLPFVYNLKVMYAARRVCFVTALQITILELSTDWIVNSVLYPIAFCEMKI